MAEPITVARASSTAEIDVAAPPQLPRPSRHRLWPRLVPVGVAVLMAAVLMLARRSGAGGLAGNPVYLMFPVLMLVSVIGGVAAGWRHGHADEQERDEYFDYLAGLRVTVTKADTARWESLWSRHPPPAALWTLIGAPSTWRGVPVEPDFGVVRIGIGPVASAVRLRTAPPALDAGNGGNDRSDPVAAAALHDLLNTHSVIDGAPVTVDLLGSPFVALTGSVDAARALLRAVLCRLAVLRGPDALWIVAVADDPSVWDWLKWLPHHRHPTAVDGAGPARMAYPDLAAAIAGIPRLGLPGADVGPAVLLILDLSSPDTSSPETSSAANVSVLERIGAGVTVVAVGAEPREQDRLRLRVDADVLRLQTRDGESRCHPDRMDPYTATACARRLAGWHATQPPCPPPNRCAAWPGLLGIDDIHRFDPDIGWRDTQRLRIPIGTGTDGAPVHLDIREAAENGMGPHGLCIGATGSGKSELLRTIALAMITRHSPETLNLVLIDFKGGATFRELERAAHVSAVITNLADDAPLVARMRDALAGELNRRQEILRRSGNLASIAAYRTARAARAARDSGTSLPPLPELLVIVDEFSELLSQHPDFVDMFVTIGRLGRSLGVYLLLASQRLDDGRLRGLDAHLSYRICLKTLSAAESRAVLGVADAHELPASPGLGYLRTPAGELIRFRSAFVSGPAPGADTPAPPTTEIAARPFTATPVEPVSGRIAEASPARSTVMTVMLDRIAGHGPPAHRVWLPPLGRSPTLAALLDEAAGDEAGLVVPIGVVDRPYRQCRTALHADLRGAAGHVAVIGSPRSGKSTALVTLVTALAATHDPTRVQVYCLDFGGGTLSALRRLPQVGSVAERSEPELVRRTITHLASLVARREKHSGSGYGTDRRRSAAARSDDAGGHVFLVIDGWAALCREFDVEDAVTALTARGLSSGVHVVLSASRWAELRPALRDQIGTRIELRLGEPADSEIDRRAAQQVPLDRPGRGLTESGLHTLIAWPSLVDFPPAEAQPGEVQPGEVRPGDPRPDLPAVVAHTAELLRARYGTVVASVPVLPATVRPTDLPGTDRPTLGLGEDELDVVTLDFDAQPHLLIFGETEAGKTTTLRTLCAELTRTTTGRDAQLFVVDYRHGLLDAVDAAHLAGYAASPAAATALIPDLIGRLAQRMPGSQVDAEQLRRRSWWTGPQLYLIVDDYDLVAGPSGNPLTALLEYLPYSRDLGLHLLIARRSGGATRALYEPLLAAVRDLGCMGLVMSGDPDEGPLVASVRPTALPPGRATLITRAGGEQRVQVTLQTDPREAFPGAQGPDR